MSAPVGCRDTHGRILARKLGGGKAWGAAEPVGIGQAFASSRLLYRVRSQLRQSKNTPPEIINKLNRGINDALADAKLKVRIAELASSAVGGSPADYAKLLAEEAEKWAKVIQAGGIKPE